MFKSEWHAFSLNNLDFFLSRMPVNLGGRSRSDTTLLVSGGLSGGGGGSLHEDDDFYA